MTDWDEIKRLAADFQKVQLSSSSQRLSERNCIEIVSWLMQRKIIDLIFTSDGKEYMTPSHLVNDIRGELYVNSGRINLVELAKIIGVDLSHINAHLHEVLKGHKDIHSVLGQLVDATYVTRIAGEINEKLQQIGQINVNDLTLQYDLPAEFVQVQVVEKNLGKLIFGKQDKKDPRIFFTESFIARTKSKIRGALVGLTKPTPVTVILNHADVTERLFFSLFDQCCPYGSLTSRIVGAQYVPQIYTRSQNEWVNNFYKQNGYLEFDALNRLGIADYKSYLKKLFNNDSIINLNSCVISKNLLDRAEADIEECINSKSHLDLQSNLPSVFNERDIKIIIETVLYRKKSKETIIIDNYILSKAFIEDLMTACDIKLRENAKVVVESGKYQHYQIDLQTSYVKGQKLEENFEDAKIDKREERRKKASGGKSGGGTQGRETKTKSTKKHYRGGGKPEVEEIVEKKSSSLEIISLEEIIEIIREKLEDEGLDLLTEQIATYIHSTLNEKGLELSGNIYSTTVSDRMALRRQAHNKTQSKVNDSVTDIKLFQKGIKLFPAAIQTNLNKYLLKTSCTDILNSLLTHIANEENLNVTLDKFSNEQRLKFINEQLASDYKNPFSSLAKTLTGEDVDAFVNAIDDALASCSMILKKTDRKVERAMVLNHKHELLGQLEKCNDPPYVLHLTVLALFVTITQNMLLASGKHVAAILTFLKPHLSIEQMGELQSFHDLVTVMLSAGSDPPSDLEDRIARIKAIGLEFKKNPEKS